MSLELNARKWSECSNDKLWAMNLRRPNFVVQDDECHHRGWNQASVISFGWLLGTVVFNTVKTSLWQSDRPVPIVIVC